MNNLEPLIYPIYNTHIDPAVAPPDNRKR